MPHADAEHCRWSIRGHKDDVLREEPAAPDCSLLFCPMQVVVGVTDPNPLVAGAGIKILKDAGIEVRCG